jgi:hypothetical protein
MEWLDQMEIKFAKLQKQLQEINLDRFEIEVDYEYEKNKLLSKSECFFLVQKKRGLDTINLSILIDYSLAQSMCDYIEQKRKKDPESKIVEVNKDPLWVGENETEFIQLILIFEGRLHLD